MLLAFPVCNALTSRNSPAALGPNASDFVTEGGKTTGRVTL